ASRANALGLQFVPDQFVKAAYKGEWLENAQQALRGAQPLATALDDLVKELKLGVFSVLGASQDEASVEALATKLGAMADGAGRYGEWVELSRSESSLVQGGARHLAERMASGEFDVERAEREIRLCRAEAIWTQAVTLRPALRELGLGARGRLVEEFQQLEADRRVDTATSIRAGHLGQMPQGAVGMMSIIRGEIAKQRKHKPIRWLMAEAGQAIQRIKPVFLMSPLSVAQFLRPGKVEFDLLVIDEASQVRPEDALGAVARAKQVVVVGDRKQLPPTSFFDRMTSGDDDEDEEDQPDQPAMGAKATDLESILTLCEARGLPSRMLEWHYRSRDPSPRKV
ncbi:MAG: DUF3320 domain-containing protein, partial [Alphaproteobacteria bacterium]